MKKNMGKTDRVIRYIVAALIAILYFTNIITGILGIILLIVGAIFLVTSFINFCPIYMIFGFNTLAKE